MILTVNLNPAVDRTCRMPVLEPGAVNRLSMAESVAGGKAVNVAKVLRRFRMPVAAVGFLGGSGGMLIGEALEKIGVECHFTQIGQETRINTNILEENGRVTEVLEPGPEISEKELEQFLKQFAGCLESCELTVMSGSLPRGVPVDIYARLIGLCHMAGSRVILDASGEALLHGVQAGPELVKPNRREMEYLAGRPLESTEEIAGAARRLLAAGVGKVIVSLGGDGLLYADSERAVLKEAKSVQVMNTVGCGDTVVAALCMSELAGEDVETALAKAVAMAAANAATPENGCFSMDTYLELL